MINRKYFYDTVRRSLFGKRIAPEQLAGMEDLLDYWEKHYPDGDIRHLAYILATTYHETGRCMHPVREGFAKTDAGARRIVAERKYGKVGKYGFVPYGRGRVQVTWDANYKKLEDLFGLPFTKEPDLLLLSSVDARVTVESCVLGVYTGRKLIDYFNAKTDDPVNARRIINGTDKASLIASYHAKFLLALLPKLN